MKLARLIPALVLGFVILAVILGKFAIPPAARALRGRREGIAHAFDELDREVDLASKKKRDEEERLKSLEGGVEERRKRATDDAASLRTQLAKEAEEAAARAMQKAKLEAEIEHQKMLLELRNEVVAVSFDAAETVLKEKVTREVQDRLVDRFLEDIETARRI